MINSSLFWFRCSSAAKDKNTLEMSHCVIIPYSVDNTAEAIKIGKMYVK
jgi:hypothetical protein